MPPSLELYLGSRMVFSSTGKWLHPLFELEDFLADSGLSIASFGELPDGELLGLAARGRAEVEDHPGGSRLTYCP